MSSTLAVYFITFVLTRNEAIRKVYYICVCQFRFRNRRDEYGGGRSRDRGERDYDRRDRYDRDYHSRSRSRSPRKFSPKTTPIFMFKLGIFHVISSIHIH